MSDFFQRPDPQQAVPRDLSGLRQQILGAILGVSQPSASRTSNAVGGLGRGGLFGTGMGSLGGQPTAGQRTQGVLGDLLGLTSSETPGGDVLGPLGTVADQRLNDSINALNANIPGRFSSAAIHEQGNLRQRSLNDYNLLASQVLEHGRDRQLQAIMSLLGPVLGPTFGGPFTQGASGFDNFLGLLDVGSNFINPFGGGGKGKVGGTPYPAGGSFGGWGQT